jgi:hypothetical protein
MTPAPSCPGIWSWWGIGAAEVRERQSVGFTPLWCSRTLTSPGAGTGSGTSITRNTVLAGPGRS